MFSSTKGSGAQGPATAARRKSVLEIQEEVESLMPVPTAAVLPGTKSKQTIGLQLPGYLARRKSVAVTLAQADAEASGSGTASAASQRQELLARKGADAFKRALMRSMSEVPEDSVLEGPGAASNPRPSNRRQLREGSMRSLRRDTFAIANLAEGEPGTSPQGGHPHPLVGKTEGLRLTRVHKSCIVVG